MSRPALALLAEIIDAEWPSDGWRRPDDDQPGDRAERAAERFQRSVKRNLADLTASTASIEVGVDAIERERKQ